MKGADAPADGSMGGLAAGTVSALRAVKATLRARHPSAQLAVLMQDSEDPEKPASPRSDAGVPSIVSGNVLVEFGVADADFQAKALAFLVRIVRPASCAFRC